jgi:hypothetical protein
MYTTNTTTDSDDELNANNANYVNFILYIVLTIYAFCGVIYIMCFYYICKYELWKIFRTDKKDNDVTNPILVIDDTYL